MDIKTNCDELIDKVSLNCAVIQTKLLTTDLVNNWSSNMHSLEFGVVL